MRSSNILRLTLASTLILAAACDKKADPAPAGDSAAEKAADAGEAKAEGGDAAKPDAAASLKDLKATIDGKAVEGLYAFAQLDEGRGEYYQVTFMNVEATCDSMQQVMMKQHETMTMFTLNTKRAMKPDGSLTWVNAGASYGGGASVPAEFVEMPKAEVKDGVLSATLPESVGHESSDKGKLAVAGSFSAKICSPIKARKLRKWQSMDEAEDLPVKDSNAKVTIAGKSFEVKGATAFPTPSNDAWDVRLTAKPHGCSFEVRDELILTVRVGGDAVKMGLDGSLMSGGTIFREVEGLKVEHSKTDDAVTLTLSGEQDFAPNEVAYKVAAEGKVNATICKIEKAE